MRSTRRIARIALALAAASAGLTGTAKGQSTLAITGVTVIDGTGRPPAVGTTVLIRAGRIASLGRDGSVTIPAGTRQVDGRGGYLIAGLWDMHVHLAMLGADGFASLLDHGVTSVRDLGGAMDSLLAWRAGIESGRLPGPRMLLSGPIVENAAWLTRIASLPIPGLDRLATERIGVETEADAARAADSIARLGVAVLKMRTSPRRETYVALMAAAERHGLLTAGHQPSKSIGLAGAVAAGQRSIEHIEQLGELEAMPAAERDSLVGNLARADVWITPTLVTSFGRFRPDSLIAALVAGTAADDPSQRLVTPSLRAFWKEQRALKEFDAPIEQYRSMVTGGLAGMRRLRQGGVKLLTGTDLAAIAVYPGASLHDELALLVDSLGLAPLEALQAATVEPARYFRMSDSLGTVEGGQLADLVLLDADPLEDIRNTRRIRGVVVRGEWRPVRRR